MYKTLSLAAAALFAFAPAAMLTAAPEPIVVTKTVRTNPTLYFQGVPGDGELTRQMRSFLGACGCSTSPATRRPNICSPAAGRAAAPYSR